MNLYLCRDCEGKGPRYHRRAIAQVVKSYEITLGRLGTEVEGKIFLESGGGLGNLFRDICGEEIDRHQVLSPVYCVLCRGTLEEVQMAECPHGNWELIDADQVIAQCLLCGEKKKGRVVFDDPQP